MGTRLFVLETSRVFSNMAERKKRYKKYVRYFNFFEFFVVRRVMRRRVKKCVNLIKNDVMSIFFENC